MINDSMKMINKVIAVLLLFVSSLLMGQTDTIYRRDGKQIPCTITLVNESAVFFKDKKGYGDQIELKNIAQYSKNGVLLSVSILAGISFDNSFIK